MITTLGRFARSSLFIAALASCAAATTDDDRIPSNANGGRGGNAAAGTSGSNVGGAASFAGNVAGGTAQGGTINSSGGSASGGTPATTQAMGGTTFGGSSAVAGSGTGGASQAGSGGTGTGSTCSNDSTAVLNGFTAVTGIKSISATGAAEMYWSGAVTVTPENGLLHVTGTDSPYAINVSGLLAYDNGLNATGKTGIRFSISGNFQGDLWLDSGTPTVRSVLSNASIGCDVRVPFSNFSPAPSLAQLKTLTFAVSAGSADFRVGNVGVY